MPEVGTTFQMLSPGEDMRRFERFRRLIRPGIPMAALWLLSACAPASPPEPAPPDTRGATVEGPVIPGEVIVRFRAGTSAARVEQVIANAGARIEKNLGTPELYLIRAAVGADVEALIARLRQHPEVLAAEPNRLIRRRPPPVREPGPDRY